VHFSRWSVVVTVVTHFDFSPNICVIHNKQKISLKIKFLENEPKSLSLKKLLHSYLDVLLIVYNGKRLHLPYKPMCTMQKL